MRLCSRFLRSSSGHLTLLPLGPPGEEDPARCFEQRGCTLGTRPSVALSHDGPPSPGPNLPVRSQLRGGPESARLSHRSDWPERVLMPLTGRSLRVATSDAVIVSGRSGSVSPFARRSTLESSRDGRAGFQALSVSQK